MKLHSTVFGDAAPIPAKYTCDGENINPLLLIENIPPNTKSLTLIMDDPDVTGEAWVHWILWNINPQTIKINEGVLPVGAIEGTTSFGSKGYGGPCPPHGTHRYIFRLYALDIPLNIPLTADVKHIKEVMKGHILGDATLMGTYTKL